MSCNLGGTMHAEPGILPAEERLNALDPPIDRFLVARERNTALS
jgi:hypothetical protein